MNEESNESQGLTVVRLKDKELVDKMCERARLAALRWIREQTGFVFWQQGESCSLMHYQFGSFLGISRKEKVDLSSVAKVLSHHSPFKFKKFEVTWTGGEGGYPCMHVALKPGAEWTEVTAEAWEGLLRPPHNLSELADKLLKWAQGPHNQEQWIDKAALGRQAQLRGTSWRAEYIKDYLVEIQSKAPVGLKFELKDEQFRIWFEQTPNAKADVRLGPINPVCPVDMKKVEFSELSRFREVLYDWILAQKLPADNTHLIIWRIQDRATLHRCFPVWESAGWSSSVLCTFLKEVGLEHGIMWGYSFQDPSPWEYICAPKDGTNWDKITTAILTARSSPPLTRRYGISEAAAAFVRWFTTLRPNEWLGSFTPIVEEHMKTRIGIKPEWESNNFEAYMAMLAEEISEKTEWRVKVQPWQGWGGKYRLLVRRHIPQWNAVVRQIQALGLDQGKLLSASEVERVLEGLLKINHPK